MSDPRTSPEDFASRTAEHNNARLRYRENRLVGIIDSLPQLRGVIEALTGGGFLRSEIEVIHGQAAAQKLSEATGRTGLSGLAMWLVKSIGLRDDETAMRDLYSSALDDGRFLISVLASTKERQRLATQMLQAHGGRFINFLGRFTVESMSS